MPSEDITLYAKWYDWKIDIYQAGDPVGTVGQDDLQITIQLVEIKNNQLQLYVKIENISQFYIQLYNGNFNIYDKSLGEDSYPLNIYGFTKSYSSSGNYFFYPFGDEYSRINSGQVAYVTIGFEINENTDLSDLYMTVNVGDIDLYHLYYENVYLGN